jgi:hypothetical protein
MKNIKKEIDKFNTFKYKIKSYKDEDIELVKSSFEELKNNTKKIDLKLECLLYLKIINCEINDREINKFLIEFNR